MKPAKAEWQISSCVASKNWCATSVQHKAECHLHYARHKIRGCNFSDISIIATMLVLDPRNQETPSKATLSESLYLQPDTL